MHDQLRGHDVKHPVGERKVLSGGLAHCDARQPLPGGSSKRRRRLRRAHRVGAQPSDQLCGQRTWPAADIQRPLPAAHSCEISEQDGQRLGVPPHERPVSIRSSESEAHRFGTSGSGVSPPCKSDIRKTTA